MTSNRVTLLVFAMCVTARLLSQAAEQQQTNAIHVVSPGTLIYDTRNKVAIYSNDVVITSEEAVITADRVEYHQTDDVLIGVGNVRIQQGAQVWVGERILYDRKTGRLVSEQFRTGQAPVFASGRGLTTDLTNQVYYATNALITTDDISKPAIKIRASRIEIDPDERIRATHATVWLGPVPVFYFQYYSRRLDEEANQFNFTPGYRSRFGGFLLTTYDWIWNEHLDGAIHLDYRQKRGFAGGPDLGFHLGRWGDGSIRYYYAHDEDPSTNGLTAPVYENRQRLYFDYQANPFTNFTLKALARYQSDVGVVREFFEGEYRRNPQPNTFVEANKFWDNFSLNVLAQPRINEFYETVERLPDVRLTGFRQQIGWLPLYYESESSAGYYRRRFAETNAAPVGLNFEAARADTYHQIVLPHTFFGWLNVQPRVGGRFTYYSEAEGPGAVTEEAHRGVFNTGAEVSFKASRLWRNAQSSFFEMDGLRHIIEPSANYVYVPKPNERPFELPQFDYELPSLRLLPINYPDYNAIDSVDTENAVRFGLRNKLQTKRNGRVEDLLRWEVFTDWRLHPRTNQQTYSDVYSDAILRPRSWLTLHSQTRFDINNEQMRMTLHTATIEPNNVWNWTIGHFYLRDDFSGTPTSLGLGNDLITSSVFYRMNENWGFRASHHYDLRNDRLQEQYYTVYRDMRSWTAALTAGLRDDGSGPEDFVITFNFSLKARPKYALGSDTVRPHSLLGR